MEVNIGMDEIIEDQLDQRIKRRVKELVEEKMTQMEDGFIQISQNQV